MAGKNQLTQKSESMLICLQRAIGSYMVSFARDRLNSTFRLLLSDAIKKDEADSDELIALSNRLFRDIEAVEREEGPGSADHIKSFYALSAQYAIAGLGEGSYIEGLEWIRDALDKVIIGGG